MTLRTYMNTWIDRVLILKRPRSIQSMTSHMRTLSEGLGDKRLPLNFNDVQEFFSKLSSRMKPKSVKNVYATFRTVMAQAEREGVIDKIPKPVLPRVRREPQPWFTLEQMKKLIQETQTPEERFLYWLLAETGMRVDEALSLLRSDVSPYNQTVSVARNLKTDESRRVVALSTRLSELADHIVYGNPAYRVFSGSSTLWRKRLKTALEKTGITIEGAPFHAFRRGCISACASLGMPSEILKQRVGHAQGDLTYGVYNQVRLPDREWAEKLGSLLVV
jgi:integrase